MTLAVRLRDRFGAGRKTRNRLLFVVLKHFEIILREVANVISFFMTAAGCWSAGAAAGGGGGAGCCCASTGWAFSKNKSAAIAAARPTPFKQLRCVIM